MPRFRKKPVVIEAFQWNGEDVAGYEKNHVGLVLPTLEGEMYASDGDWIITGIKGEVYACKPDIFAATYDLVE